MRPPHSRGTLIAIIVGAYLIVPAGLIVSLALSHPASAREAWPDAALVAILIGYFTSLGNWGWLGLPVRWTLVAGLAVAEWSSLGPLGTAGALVIAAATARLVLGHAGRVPTYETPIALAPPFPSGAFFIGQGGAAARLNHHFRSRSQRYALDIERLGWWGTRCSGLYPAQLDRYCIYGVSVLSPCNGVVTFVEDQIPDEIPPARNRRTLAGNLVMIAADGTDVLVGLAHLQPGSATVRAGDRVRIGQPLARVGNSGNSTEPHLHLQAKRGGSRESLLDGEGVPMLIRGRFLRRNHVIRGVRAAPAANAPQPAAVGQAQR